MKKLLVISYSRAFAQRLEVEKLLSRLEKMGVSEFADIWWDSEIPSGADWQAKIREKFEAADGYFVLGSNSYLESEAIRKHEWPVIERRVKSGAARLFWTSFDRPADSYPAQMNLSRFNAAAGRWAPLNEADTPAKKNDFLTQLAEEIASFLVGTEAAHESSTGRISARTPTPREIEAAYLEALSHHCAPLVNRERFLPIQQLYVRLKADERTAEENKAGETLLNQKIRADIIEDDCGASSKTVDEIIGERLKLQPEVVQLPVEASVRFTGTHFSGDTLEDIFQHHRFLVVRGGPGSGKTVLCWQIAMTLGAAWQEEFEMRPVKTIRRMSKGFGVARLPILIPIRDYAKACRERHGDLTLASFIGTHLQQEETIEASFFNAFLLQQVKEGRTVLLLDGLDEVPAMDRHQIVESIQTFLRTYVTPTIAGADGDPGEVGGNQMVITSRLAGYELAPVTDEAFRHFIIRPFDEEAIEKYCRSWAKMVFEPRTPNHRERANELVQTILTDSNPTIQELAKNPLLLQVLCELAAPQDVKEDDPAWDQVNELPYIRAEIYGQAIRVMAKRWEKAYESVAEKNEHVRDLLKPGKMEELLSYVALEMHREEVLTRVTREQLRRWLTEALCKVEQKPLLTRDPVDVSRTTSALLDLVRTHVGVISESAPGVFQFHHLTFQEYLAGSACCRTHNGKSWASAEQLGRQIASADGGLPDQRWREPWLLGFGHLSTAAKDDPKAPCPAVVLRVLRAAWREKEADTSPEEAALLLATLLFELPDDSIQDLLEQVLRDLLVCYKTWHEAGVSEESSRPFIQAMTRLRRRLSSQTTVSVFNPFDVIAAKIIETTPELSAPLARVCMDRGWLTRPILKAFVACRSHDQAAWHWPLHQGLRRAVLDHDDLEPRAVAQFKMPDTPAKIQDRNNYERALDAWHEQRRSDAERMLRPVLPTQPRVQTLLPASLEQIRARRPEVLRQIMALCGGFGDFQCARWTREYAEIAFFLQQPDALRAGAINEAPEAFLPRWGADDTIYNMAVYLDLKQGGRSKLIQKPAVFALQNLSHDPTPEMLRVLEAALDATRDGRARISDLLHELAATTERPDVAAEAWVALLAVGQGSSMPAHPAVTERVRWHCARMVDDFRDPVIRFAHRQKEAAGNEEPAAASQPDDLWGILNRWLPTLPEVQAAQIFRLVMQALTEAHNEPVKPLLVWEGNLESPLGLALWGEQWAAALAGRSDDDVYNLAKALDELKFAAEPIQVLRQCVAIVTSANIRFIPGAHTGLLPPAVFSSNAAAVDYFCTALQFLCEAAGTFKAKDVEFRAGMFNKMTAQLFKQSGHPPLFLVLLADYMHAAKEEHFAITPEEFMALRKRLAGAEELDYPLSAEWKLADLLGREPAQHHTSHQADWELAMQMCRSDAVSASDGWKAFTLFLAGLVAGQSSHAVESHDDLWLRLESDVRQKPERLGETMAYILTRVSSGGLAMSETAARVIETLAHLESHSARAVLQSILPLMDHATPSEAGRLRHWVAKNWCPKIPDETANLLAGHAALLLAEHNSVLEPAWVRPVLELALNGDDRSQARAVLLLGGSITHVKRGTRRRALSAMGADALQELTKCYFHECVTTGKEKQMLMCFDDMHFDHHESTRWLLEHRNPADEELTALPYHFGSGTWTPEALEAFAVWLAADSTHWNDAFIMGYGCLVYYQAHEIPESLHRIMREKIESLKVSSHLLPETESYGIVIKASLKALADKGAKTPHHRAAAVLRGNCECLRAGVLVGGSDLMQACAAIAESGLQWYDTYPEDCWSDIAEHLNNDHLFELLFHWLAEELQAWSKWRSSGIRPFTPSEAFSNSLRNALLSILCVMTERNRDYFVLLAQELQQRGQCLASHLSEAAVHHRKVRSRMAAMTLLSRLPNLDGAEVARVVRSALGDDERMRKRAQMLIPHFREFQVTDAFLADALAKLKGNEPASIVLAYARLLTNLLHANQVKAPGKRREIMNALRSAANDIRNTRMLAYLAGSGAADSPRKIVNDGRLDQALVAVMAQGYSDFFKNV